MWLPPVKIPSFRAKKKFHFLSHPSPHLLGCFQHFLSRHHYLQCRYCSWISDSDSKLFKLCKRDKFMWLKSVNKVGNHSIFSQNEKKITWHLWPFVPLLLVKWNIIIFCQSLFTILNPSHFKFYGLFMPTKLYRLKNYFLIGRERVKCVVMDSLGFWIPTMCRGRLSSYKYICKTGKTNLTPPSTMPTTSPPPPCPREWRSSGRYCYKVGRTFMESYDRQCPSHIF